MKLIEIYEWFMQPRDSQVVQSYLFTFFAGVIVTFLFAKQYVNYHLSNYEDDVLDDRVYSRKKYLFCIHLNTDKAFYKLTNILDFNFQGVNYKSRKDNTIIVIKVDTGTIMEIIDFIYEKDIVNVSIVEKLQGDKNTRFWTHPKYKNKVKSQTKAITPVRLDTLDVHAFDRIINKVHYVETKKERHYKIAFNTNVAAAFYNWYYNTFDSDNVDINSKVIYISTKLSSINAIIANNGKYIKHVTRVYEFDENEKNYIIVYDNDKD